MRRLQVVRKVRSRVKPKITDEEIKAAVSYDPETGNFVRLRPTEGRWKAGTIQGHLSESGYWRLSINGVHLQAHRVAFFLMMGHWPQNEIDHRDLNRSNNKWSNLREATRPQNRANCAKRAHNTSGWKGVSRTRHVGVWRGSITVNGKQRHLGSFRCPAAAHLAFVVASAVERGEFARSA